ncbi:Hermansky-Pudlak syndrome 4 protein [Electrophorus electricus]|uniref:Hermansky-Pudlak syndrome 4 protein n=1 Tax=Electrophorus electricus TaxID=8005 RepID=UPI0015D02A3F|nr:Hermansky-Pudlak syndrome 4 protein [Electrophorus electricus]
MAAESETRRINVFFLYDCSKVQEECDLTRAGICYFYPEDTPLEHQELLCGQLAGVSRCVSELSCSPVHLLRLRKSKYAVRMRDTFLWVLSCVSEVPDISVCEFLDHLIGLFCFYNGPVQQSYQLHSQGELALHWARYISHLQGGSTELHHIFSCLETIRSTRIDPLLLLKSALILQACQRCPLVLAGCLLYQGRVLSTQMCPELTRKVMVNETETYSQEDRLQAHGVCWSGATPPSNTVTTPVFLTSSEVNTLRCHPVDNSCRFHCSSQPPDQPKKTPLLSRTLSDIANTDLDPAELEHALCPPAHYQTHSSPHSSLSDEESFSLCPSTASTPLHLTVTSQSEGSPSESHDHILPNGTLLYKAIESSMFEGGSPVRSEGERNTAEVVAVTGGDPVRSEGERNTAEIVEVTGGDPVRSEGERNTAEVVEVTGGDPVRSEGERNTAEVVEVTGGDPVRSEGERNTAEVVEVTGGDPVRSEGERNTAEVVEVTGPEQDQVSAISNGLESGQDSPPQHDGEGEGTKEMEVRGGVKEEMREGGRSGDCRSPSGGTLDCLLLYQHRVGSLVLAVLVEPHFNTDASAKEDVYFSCLASLNGLEAHLRTTSSQPPPAQGPYIYTHYDCVQNTLTTNVSEHSSSSQDSFVKATALLHSDFSLKDTLQEAIVRNASCAVYATRTKAQETYFLQQGTSARNSGIPNVQDTAFSLPGKARQRLLKHGVNLL